MKTFKCADLGLKCAFVTTGKTVDEVKQKAMAHAQVGHAELYRNVNTPQRVAEFEAMVIKKIT